MLLGLTIALLPEHLMGIRCWDLQKSIYSKKNEGATLLSNELSLSKGLFRPMTMKKAISYLEK